MPRQARKGDMFHIVRKFEDLRGAYADGQLDGVSVRSVLPYIVCSV